MSLDMSFIRINIVDSKVLKHDYTRKWYYLQSKVTTM